MPGLSMMMPPPGSRTSSRRVVVCRPAPSARDLARREPGVVADQRVDERRLADARGTEQHPRRRPAPSIARTASSPSRCPRRHRVDRNLAADRRRPPRRRPRDRLEVGLGEDDDRPRAALEREREVALEQPAVELLSERAGRRNDVDVRGDDLLARDVRTRLVRRAARDRAFAAAGRRRLSLPGRARPSRRRREARSRVGLPAEAARDAAALLALARQDVVLAAMLNRDPARGRAPRSRYGSNAALQASSQPSVARSGTGALSSDGCRGGVDRATASSHFARRGSRVAAVSDRRERERTMTRRAVPVWALAALSLVFARRSRQSVAGARPPPTRRTGRSPRRSILFASDGMRPDLVDKYAAAGAMADDGRAHGRRRQGPERPEAGLPAQHRRRLVRPSPPARGRASTARRTTPSTARARRSFNNSRRSPEP